MQHAQKIRHSNDELKETLPNIGGPSTSAGGPPQELRYLYSINGPPSAGGPVLAFGTVWCLYERNIAESISKDPTTVITPMVLKEGGSGKIKKSSLDKF